MSLTTYSINNKDWNLLPSFPCLALLVLTTYSINNKDWNSLLSMSFIACSNLTTYSINNKDWNTRQTGTMGKTPALNDLFH